MSSISIENVSFAYDDPLQRRKPGEEQVLALSGIDLEIADGQFVCLIGHSGSGKSTLLRLLLGLDKPTSGRICIDGEPIEGPALNRSFVFQDYSLFPWMKVQENVEFGIEQANRELGRGLSRAAISETARLNLERVGMEDAASQYPYQLSGGMKQRVAIARALAMDTDILFFDEPFGALDVKTRRALQELVDELWRSGARRKTVVFVTHDISEAIVLADRIVVMRKGELIADNPIALPRPRTPEAIARDEAAQRLESELTELFYLDGDEVENVSSVGVLEAGDSR